MRLPYQRILAALALMMPLSLLTSAAIGSAAAVPAVVSDGLSGTWQVSRICLTVCTSPRPVLKVVRHWQGAVFMTGGLAPQVLYLLKTQVLVHGPKDSLVLTIGSRGLLMSGPGVGADGSTFETTWRCVASAVATAAPGLTLNHASFTNPAEKPMGMGLC